MRITITIDTQGAPTPLVDLQQADDVVNVVISPTSAASVLDEQPAERAAAPAAPTIDEDGFRSLIDPKGV